MKPKPKVTDNPRPKTVPIDPKPELLAPRPNYSEAIWQMVVSGW